MMNVTGFAKYTRLDSQFDDRQRRHYFKKKVIFFLRRATVIRRDGSTVEALRLAKGRRTVFPQPLSTPEKLVPALNKHCRN